LVNLSVKLLKNVTVNQLFNKLFKGELYQKPKDKNQ
jgi:hypothetical protein